MLGRLSLSSGLPGDRAGVVEERAGRSRGAEQRGSDDDVSRLIGRCGRGRPVVRATEIGLHPPGTDRVDLDRRARQAPWRGRWSVRSAPPSTSGTPARPARSTATPGSAWSDSEPMVLDTLTIRPASDGAQQREERLRDGDGTEHVRAEGPVEQVAGREAGPPPPPSASGRIPALLTRMSTRPCSRVTRSTRCGHAGWIRDVELDRAGVDALLAEGPRRQRAERSSSRAAMTMLTPDRPRSRAVARPSPRFPPVITATLVEVLVSSAVPTVMGPACPLLQGRSGGNRTSREA